MTIRQTEAHTFIIRIHRAGSRSRSAGGEWHGEVVHVPSRRSASFRGLDTVDDVMERLLDPEHPNSAPHT